MVSILPKHTQHIYKHTNKQHNSISMNLSMKHHKQHEQHEQHEQGNEETPTFTKRLW